MWKNEAFVEEFRLRCHDFLIYVDRSEANEGLICMFSAVSVCIPLY